MALSLTLVLLILVVNSAQGAQEVPDVGDKVEVILRNGNAISGVMTGVDAEGYRVDLDGTEVVVPHDSIRSIAVGGKTTAPPSVLEPGDVGEALPSDRLVGANSDSIDDFSTAPPKPRSRGTGFLTSGLVLTAAGVGLMTAGIVGLSDEVRDEISLDNEDDNSALWASLTILGFASSLSGLGLTVTGIVMKTISGSQRRAWEKTYGRRPPSESFWFAITPPAPSQRSFGVAVGGRF